MIGPVDPLWERMEAWRRDQERSARADFLAALPGQAAVDLLVLPAWTPSLLAGLGLPAPPASRFVATSPARDDLRVPEAAADDPALARGWWADGARDALLAERPGVTADQLLWRAGELARRCLAWRDHTSTPAALPAATLAWAEVARWLPDLDHTRAELERALDHALDDADAAAALRVVRAARALTWLHPALERLAVRLSRRQALRERIDDDERRLAFHISRPELIAAFDRLIDAGPDGPWALHYVGPGGVGKTQLAREIGARLVRARGGVCARVDFDTLDPAYPVRDPGLLFAALTEELALQDDLQHGAAEEQAFHQVRGRARYVRAGLRPDDDARPSGSSGSPGSPATDADEEQAVQHFAAFIQRLPGPVVLVLDTCEELDRVRLSDRVSTAVRATLRLLDRLHAAAPQVRVVLLGRRLLTEAGWGWRRTDHPDTAGAPSAPGLMLCEVRGFLPSEADAFLDAVRRDHPRGDALGPGPLREALLGASRVAPASAVAVTWDDPTHAPIAGARLGPWELAHGAPWVLDDPDVTPALLRGDGDGALFDLRYVGHRIVGRLHPAERRVLPALIALGETTEPLLRAAADLDDAAWPDAAALLRHEWVGRSADGDRWTVDGDLRRRVEAWLRKEDPTGWGVAVERATRAARQLSEPDAHVAATLARLLTDRPREARAWWSALAAGLRGRDDARLERIAGHVVARLDDTHPLAADALATLAGVRTSRGAPSPELTDAWRRVARLVAARTPAGPDDDALARAAAILGHGARWTAPPADRVAATDRGATGGVDEAAPGTASAAQPPVAPSAAGPLDHPLVLGAVLAAWEAALDAGWLAGAPPATEETRPPPDLTPRQAAAWAWLAGRQRAAERRFADAARSLQIARDLAGAPAEPADHLPCWSPPDDPVGLYAGWSIRLLWPARWSEEEVWHALPPSSNPGLARVRAWASPTAALATVEPTWWPRRARLLAGDLPPTAAQIAFHAALHTGEVGPVIATAHPDDETAALRLRVEAARLLRWPDPTTRIAASHWTLLAGLARSPRPADGAAWEAWRTFADGDTEGLPAPAALDPAMLADTPAWRGVHPPDPTHPIALRAAFARRLAGGDDTVDTVNTVDLAAALAGWPEHALALTVLAHAWTALTGEAAPRALADAVRRVGARAAGIALLSAGDVLAQHRPDLGAAVLAAAIPLLDGHPIQDAARVATALARRAAGDADGALLIAREAHPDALSAGWRLRLDALLTDGPGPWPPDLARALGPHGGERAAPPEPTWQARADLPVERLGPDDPLHVTWTPPGGEPFVLDHARVFHGGTTPLLTARVPADAVARFATPDLPSLAVPVEGLLAGRATGGIARLMAVQGWTCEALTVAVLATSRDQRGALGHWSGWTWSRGEAPAGIVHLVVDRDAGGTGAPELRLPTELFTKGSVTIGEQTWTSDDLATQVARRLAPGGLVVVQVPPVGASPGAIERLGLARARVGLGALLARVPHAGAAVLLPPADPDLLAGAFAELRAADRTAALLGLRALLAHTLPDLPADLAWSTCVILPGD